MILNIGKIGDIHIDYYDTMLTDIIVMDISEFHSYYYADTDKWSTIIIIGDGGIIV